MMPPLMGKHLAKMAVKPVPIISLPAKRAKKTAKTVTEEIGIILKILYRETIYEASPQSLLYMIYQLPEDAKREMIVGHNPGLIG